MLAKHEMFEKFGGGETSKQGRDVETISCQANNVGQFRQALKPFAQDISLMFLSPQLYHLFQTFQFLTVIYFNAFN